MFLIVAEAACLATRIVLKIATESTHYRVSEVQPVNNLHIIFFANIFSVTESYRSVHQE